MLRKKLVFAMGYLSAALALAACGGSGTDAAPTVQAGADISLKEGRSAVLHACLTTMLVISSNGVRSLALHYN
ncbi:hypothetical protein [Rheinheimera soli]|uniref:hypothetical protein n=1 Tax=Rheinheimera soli TaxID=443616 RepID=UPI00286C880C|nr:hypothetical protein [Rheinheimera soli]